MAPDLTYNDPWHIIVHSTYICVLYLTYIFFLHIVWFSLVKLKAPTLKRKKNIMPTLEQQSLLCNSVQTYLLWMVIDWFIGSVKERKNQWTKS